MMDIKAVPQRHSSRAGFSWHRAPAHGNIVCKFWLAGNCTRTPCRFLHSEEKRDAPIGRSSSNTWTRPTSENYQDSHLSLQFERASSVNMSDEDIGISSDGGNTRNKSPLLHSWFSGDGFTLMACLEGHKKGVTGIALPSSSGMLYTGSRDGTVRIWNSHSGECAEVVDLGAEVGSLTSEGHWVFVGIPNAVKAWNTQTFVDLNLSGPVGQVYAMAVGENILLAGAQDGAIWAWKFNSETNLFEEFACMKGHSGAVVSLLVMGNRLYSGSVDNTIRVWESQTFQCIQILNEHRNVVMSMLSWDQFLLSSSPDQMLKIWAPTEGGNVEVTHTRHEESGILALCGMKDAEGKPVLFCSCSDNTVRLYELPSFIERGRIFTGKEVRTVQIGSGGLFFTGDEAGRLSVWRFLERPNASSTTSTSL